MKFTFVAEGGFAWFGFGRPRGGTCPMAFCLGPVRLQLGAGTLAQAVMAEVGQHRMRREDEGARQQQELKRQLLEASTNVSRLMKAAGQLREELVEVQYIADARARRIEEMEKGLKEISRWGQILALAPQPMPANETTKAGGQAK